MPAAQGQTIQVADDIYYLGAGSVNGGLTCNAYLLIDGEEGVLIEPGSVLDFARVARNLEAVMPVRRVRHVILHHQDPDLASSMPLFEKRGMKASIVTSWRAASLILFYGVTSPFYLVDEHKYLLTLESGRRLRFIPTPYLHFSGAFVTYDEKTKTLFSSDLFGAFSREWSLYADDTYMEPMKAFHEHYMPSNDILRPVMELFSGMDIRMIAPQHGSIISERIPEHIAALKELECGSFMIPVRRALAKKGDRTSLCNQVLKRYYALYPREEVMAVFRGSPIRLDEATGLMRDVAAPAADPWEVFFEVIAAKKGVQWLAVVQPKILELASEYNVPQPRVLRSALISVQSQYDALKKEHENLAESARTLQSKIREAESLMVIHPLTGLYNESFFRKFLHEEIVANQPGEFNFSVIFLEIDNLIQINNKHGRDTGDETLVHLSYLIRSFIKEEPSRGTHVVFKLSGNGYAYFTARSSMDHTIQTAEELRTKIITADIFITPLSVSMGIVSRIDLVIEGELSDGLVRRIIDTGRMKVRVARKTGKNIIYDKVDLDQYGELAGKVLLADPDTAGIDMLKKALLQLHYEVLSCAGGTQALEIIERERPSAVVCELMLPGMDGFAIRRRMLESSRLKDIAFVLVSFEKNEELVQRALALGISHFFKKPYYHSEIAGVVKMKLEENP